MVSNMFATLIRTMPLEIWLVYLAKIVEMAALILALISKCVCNNKLGINFLSSPKVLKLCYSLSCHH